MSARSRLGRRTGSRPAGRPETPRRDRRRAARRRTRQARCPDRTFLRALAPQRRRVVGGKQVPEPPRERDARPPCARRQGARCRVSAKPRKANATGAIAAGVALASGWPENGSVSGATRSQMRAAEAVVSLQWIGANSEPRRCPASTTTLSTQAPCGSRPGQSRRRRGRRPRRRPDAPRRTAPAMRRQARAQAGARHRVPLVAHAAGVEAERVLGIDLGLQRGRLGRDEARLAVGREEAAVGEEAGAPLPDPPLQRRGGTRGTGHCTGSSAS